VLRTIYGVCIELFSEYSTGNALKCWSKVGSDAIAFVASEVNYKNVKYHLADIPP
jgi:hypothetical protein